MLKKMIIWNLGTLLLQILVGGIVYQLTGSEEEAVFTIVVTTFILSNLPEFSAGIATVLTAALATASVGAAFFAATVDNVTAVAAAAAFFAALAVACSTLAAVTALEYQREEDEDFLIYFLAALPLGIGIILTAVTVLERKILDLLESKSS